MATASYPPKASPANSPTPPAASSAPNPTAPGSASADAPVEYAENGDSYTDARPILVTIIKADLGTPDELASEAAALASAIAEITGRAAEHVHVIYEPPGRGRGAFGGQLLR